MAKKIVEVPEGAVNVIFAPAVKDNYADEVSYMIKHRVGVENLPDAPEKRVIELPADVITWLERIKSNLETIDVYDLLNNVTDYNSGSYNAYQFNFNSETDALNTLAEWVLGHVEFVPKKYPKFKVLVELHEGDLWVTKNRTHDIDDEEISFSQFDNDHDTRGRYKFTEEEADELVAGLTALNARKMKVDD